MPNNSATRSERRTSAIVTGAAGGIGSAEATRLADNGHLVVVNDVDPGRLAELVDRLGGPAAATPVPGDIRDADTARALVAAATNDDRRLACVINNAGITADRMIFNMSDDDWDQTLAVNLRGTFLLSREAAAHWRQAAKATDTPPVSYLINTTSRAGLLANPGQANYGAAKAGVAALTLILSRELRRYGVRCNAVAPRAFTPMMQASFGDFREDELQQWSPDYIARFVEFLCGPAGEQITGQVFVVRGPEVSLARPWTLSDPVTIDYGADDVLGQVEATFDGEPTVLPPFQVGGDLPLVGQG